MQAIWHSERRMYKILDPTTEHYSYVTLDIYDTIVKVNHCNCQTYKESHRIHLRRTCPHIAFVYNHCLDKNNYTVHICKR